MDLRFPIGFVTIELELKVPVEQSRSGHLQSSLVGEDYAHLVIDPMLRSVIGVSLPQAARACDMQAFSSTTSSALLPVREHFVDRWSRSQALCRSGRKHTMPETRYIEGDLALPSVGRYQMKVDLHPADVTLHDAYLAATPTGSSVPCTKLIRCS